MRYETPQEVLDTVAQHLIEQKAKSLNDSLAVLDAGPECLYRNSDGMKCAVGALIPDSVYRKEFERFPSVFQLIDSVSEVRSLFGEEILRTHHVNLLRQLQDIHDTCSVESWPHALRNVADLHDLRVPECVQTALRGDWKGIWS